MDEDVEHALQPPPSHLSQVPNEILAQIFTAGTEEWRDLDPGGLPFPVLVSAVCKYWRMLSHSTQNLWTFIVPPLKKNPTECLNWTSEWIKRSGAMAISVILNDTLFSPRVIVSEDAIDPEALAVLILSLMRQCSHRLHRIDICLKNISLPIVKALENLSSAQPPLREISICSPLRAHPSYLIFSSSSTEFSWLKALPDLRKFRFQDSSYRRAIFPGVNNRCAIPYISNLVSLDLSHLRLTHSELEILFAPSHCRLETLVLRHLHPNRSQVPRDTSPVKVETLRTVAVSTPANYIRGDHETFLFSWLIIPNITYLEIDSNVPISILFGNSLSASKIETLKISNQLPISLSHGHHLTRHKEDMEIFRSFSCIQNLELIRLHSSAKLLLSGLFNEKGTTMTRKRSVNFHPRALDDADGPDIAAPERSSMFWPNLRSITLDTIIPGDVKSLIDFTKRHKNVQEISLSPSAMRNLADLERRGDEIGLPTPTLYKYREGMINADEQATKDVSEWLGKRVKLIQSRRSNVDLLLWERSDRAPSRRLSSG